MIKNAREYQITKSQAAKFERALSDLSTRSELERLERDALESQLADLRMELADYDALESGRLKVIEVEDLSALPDALIRARISAGLSQKELASRLSLREQQIQRYEATGYASASLSRLREVVSALGIQLRQDVILPSADLSMETLEAELKNVGLDQSFVRSRLVPDLASVDTPSGCWRTANVVGRIFGMPASEIVSSGVHVKQQPTLYKLPLSASEKKLPGYGMYARYLAGRLLASIPAPLSRELPDDPDVFRNAVFSSYGAFTFDTVLRTIWDLGIPVLPLRDRGTFHGAFWRVSGRPVIVIKQHVFSNSRWLIDLLHEYRHAIQTQDVSDVDIIEETESPSARASSPPEKEATQWASAVVLDGREQELADECVKLANREVPRLKAAVIAIAQRENVPVDALANYIAYRLSAEGTDWWGVAANLQPKGDDPCGTARDVLLERIELHRLDSTDRALLTRALSEED